MKNDVRLSGIELVTPYPMLTTSDMYRVPPPEMLVEGMIPKQSITGITSYPGVGKTWLAFEITRALGAGDPVLGKLKVDGAGPVLFVGSDASKFDYAEQWRRLTRKTWSSFVPTEEQTKDPDFVEPVNLLEENVRFLVQSDFLFENLDSIRSLIRTIQTHETGTPYFEPDGTTDAWGGPGGSWVHQKGFSLVVFDTLSKLTRANQNDNSEMEEVFRNIRLITETTGAAVLLLHHNSKRNEFNGGDDWRGAMAQIGALDGWLNVSKPYKDKSKVKVDVKKFRGRQPKPFAYRMDVDEEDDALLGWIDIEQEKTERERKEHEVREEVKSVMTTGELKIETVPEFVRHLLLSGSKSRAMILESSILKFDDATADKVTDRVDAALRDMRKRKEIYTNRPKKGGVRHYQLADGVK